MRLVIKRRSELNEKQFFIRIPKVIIYVDFFFSFHLKEKKCHSKISIQLLDTSRLSCKTIILCVDIYIYVLSAAMSKPSKFYSFQVCKDVSYTKPVSVTHAFAFFFFAIYKVVVPGSLYSLPFSTEPADVCGSLVGNWLQL